MPTARALARLSLNQTAARLGARDSEAARARLALLLGFGDAVGELAPLVWAGDAHGFGWTLGARLCALACVLPRLVRQKLWGRAVLSSQLAGAHTPTATLDRVRAAEARERARVDPVGAARSTVLLQMAAQLCVEMGHSLRQRTRPFRVRLAGEASDDLGGPFREAIAEACMDLAYGPAALLSPTPNSANATGSHRDCWLPKPEATSAREMKLFELIGALIGTALRHDEPLIDLQLAPSVWRALLFGPLVRPRRAHTPPHPRTVRTARRARDSGPKGQHALALVRMGRARPTIRTVGRAAPSGRMAPSGREARPTQEARTVGRASRTAPARGDSSTVSSRSTIHPSTRRFRARPRPRRISNRPRPTLHSARMIRAFSSRSRSCARWPSAV